MGCDKAKVTYDRGDGKIINYCKESNCSKGFKVPTGRSCYEGSGNSGGGYQY